MKEDKVTVLIDSGNFMIGHDFPNTRAFLREYAVKRKKKVFSVKVSENEFLEVRFCKILFSDGSGSKQTYLMKLVSEDEKSMERFSELLSQDGWYSGTT